MTKLYTMTEYLNLNTNNNMTDIEEINFEIIDEEILIDLLPKELEDMIFDYKYEMEHKERMVRVMKELLNKTSLRSCFINYNHLEEGEGQDGNYFWSDFSYLDIDIYGYSQMTNTYIKDGELMSLTKNEYVEYYMTKIDERIREDNLKIFEFNRVGIDFNNGQFEELVDFERLVVIDY